MKYNFKEKDKKKIRQKVKDKIERDTTKAKLIRNYRD